MVKEERKELSGISEEALIKMNSLSIEECQHRFITDGIKFYEITISIKEIDGL